MRWLGKGKGKLFQDQRGITLMEILVALALLGMIGVTFFNGLTVASKANFIADERATAESLAQSQMEWVRNTGYVEGATQYSAAPIPSGGEYINYSVNITAQPLNNPDDGIQRITVTIKHFDKRVIELESYKRQR